MVFRPSAAPQFCAKYGPVVGPWCHQTRVPIIKPPKPRQHQDQQNMLKPARLAVIRLPGSPFPQELDTLLQSYGCASLASQRAPGRCCDILVAMVAWVLGGLRSWISSLSFAGLTDGFAVQEQGGSGARYIRACLGTQTSERAGFKHKVSPFESSTIDTERRLLVRPCFFFNWPPLI